MTIMVMVSKILLLTIIKIAAMIILSIILIKEITVLKKKIKN